MKALAVNPGKKGIYITERNEPQIINHTDIKAEVLKVGICGTDIGQVEGGRADAPENKNDLVIGHEMLGRVIETGKGSRVKPGDLVVFTVRRGCGKCIPCNANRSDMCYTGDYKERGIKQLDGFQSEYVVDSEEYAVKLPEELLQTGVLIEPLSVAEKAINEALEIQMNRIPGYDKENWLIDSKVMVAGIGTVGLLAAFILSLRGARVYGLDIVTADSLRPSILKNIGGKYINGNELSTYDIDDIFGEMDFIFEATGFSKLGFELSDALGINGIYVMTGIPEGNRPVTIHGDNLMRQIVLKNQVIIGSVNAEYKNFISAVEDLQQINRKWGSEIKKMITRVVPVNDFNSAFTNKPEDEIKTVIQWK